MNILNALFQYIGLTILGLLVYFGVSDLTNTPLTNIRTDVIYICSATATIFAFLVIIKSLNIWKEQHNKTTLKDFSLETWKEHEKFHNNFIFLIDFRKNLTQEPYKYLNPHVIQEYNNMIKEISLNGLSSSIKNKILSNLAKDPEIQVHSLAITTLSTTVINNLNPIFTMIAESNGIEENAMDETIKLIDSMFPIKWIDDYYEMKSSYEKLLSEQILAQ